MGATWEPCASRVGARSSRTHSVAFFFSSYSSSTVSFTPIQAMCASPRDLPWEVVGLSDHFSWGVPGSLAGGGPRDKPQKFTDPCRSAPIRTDPSTDPWKKPTDPCDP